MAAVETKSATAPAVIFILGVVLLFTPLLPIGALLCLFGGILLAVRLLASLSASNKSA